MFQGLVLSKRLENDFLTENVQTVSCESVMTGRPFPPQVTVGGSTFQQLPWKMLFLRQMSLADCNPQELGKRLLEGPSWAQRRKNVQIHSSCGKSLLYKNCARRTKTVLVSASRKHRQAQEFSLAGRVLAQHAGSPGFDTQHCLRVLEMKRQGDQKIRVVLGYILLEGSLGI